MVKSLDGATLMFDEIENKLVILDQTILPACEKLLYLDKEEEIFEAIQNLRVRGAPAIGVAAAVAVAVCARNIKSENKSEFFVKLRGICDYFSSSRPTAQNLFWAIERMYKCAENAKICDLESIKKSLAAEAKLIIDEDISICRRIGENGATLLCDVSNILTHCNAGRLAAVKYGTALAPIYIAAEKGQKIKVFADETRPLLQGVRLTAYELSQADIETTVICDNMAASLMATGKIDAVITGADRIAANFDAANKIGTLSLAILSKHFNIPFYIAAPLSTFDKMCKCGDDIIIEMRNAKEISGQWDSTNLERRPNFSYNPAFDVTPAHLISAIITEDGIIYP